MKATGKLMNYFRGCNADRIIRCQVGAGVQSSNKNNNLIIGISESASDGQVSERWSQLARYYRALQDSTSARTPSHPGSAQFGYLIQKKTNSLSNTSAKTPTVR